MLRSLPRGLALVTTSAATLVAMLCAVDCGSFSASSFGPGSDSGGGDGGGGPDGSVFGDASAPTPFKVIAVNASPDLPDVRFCMMAGGKWLTASDPIPSDARHPMPASNYPGVPRGAGAVLPAFESLPSGAVRLYAILASTLAMQATHLKCHELVCASGAGCLEKGREYYELPSFDAAELAGTRLLAITGCASGSCGPLAVRTFALDAARRADNLGVQVAALAPSLGATDVLYGSLEPDATLRPLASTRFGELQPSGAIAITLPMQPGDYARYGLVLSTGAPDASASRFAISLAAVQKLSDPTVLPSEYFRARASYVFVVLGDPSPAVPQLTLADGGENPAYDGRGLHVVAFPSVMAGDAGGAAQ